MDKSLRLKGWDYAEPGAYFVTINCKNRGPYFGHVEQSACILSKIGVIAEDVWRQIPLQFPFITLDQWVIMPDHMHGLVWVSAPGRDAINRVPTGTGGGITGEHNPMLHKNLSTVIRWYKGRTTYEAHKVEPAFAWQSRFYDRIIRDEKQLKNTRHYIIENPIRWGIEKE